MAASTSTIFRLRLATSIIWPAMPTADSPQNSLTLVSLITRPDTQNQLNWNSIPISTNNDKEAYLSGGLALQSLVDAVKEPHSGWDTNTALGAYLKV